MFVFYNSESAIEIATRTIQRIYSCVLKLSQIFEDAISRDLVLHIIPLS